MSQFKDLDEQLSPSNDDIIVIQQDSDDTNKKVKISNLPAAPIDPQIQIDIDANAADIVTLQNELDAAELNITTLQSELDAAELNITNLQNDLNTAESDISTSQSDIATLQSELNTAEANIVILQNELNTAEADIVTLQSDLSTAEGNITTLQSDLNTAESDITTLQTDLNTAESDITTLQSELNTTEADIVTLQSDVTTAESNISTNQTDISTLQTDLDAVELEQKKSVVSASAPNADNDITEGYKPGSYWLNTTDNSVYYCFDNTDGAAVWAQVSGGSGNVTNWSSAVSTNITAIGTNPSKGTIVRDRIMYRQIGDSIEVHVDYEHSAAGSAGSGTYLFELPTGFTIDTSKVDLDSDSGNPGGGTNAFGCGTVSVNSTMNLCGVKAYDSTHVLLYTPNGNPVTSSNFALSNTATRYSFIYTVPVNE